VETIASNRAKKRRVPLTRERVLRAALKLADEGGIEAVSMRKLGQTVHVEAMSLYRHVAGKEDILDGIADLVTSEFEVPAPGKHWREALRRSAISAHQALLRHPWAGSVIESRTNLGPARLRYIDSVIGVMRDAGFDLATIIRAFMALDSHTYGFALQEEAVPYDAARGPEMAAAVASSPSVAAYPNLVAMAELAASSPPGALLDFEFGLDLLLDGLERLLPPR
jgi:AcrR family transcriptional regulator